MSVTGTGNKTLDRIQQEIQEVYEREEELKIKYAQFHSNGGFKSNATNGVVSMNGNGIPNGNSVGVSSGEEKVKENNDRVTVTNGNGTNGVRRFTQNPSTRGVMQKFLRMRGKVSVAALRSPKSATWLPDNLFEPAKVTVEKGKPIRKGFVSAEEKMRRELQEFQIREDELRKERRKSQPDLMAALEAEQEAESNLRSSKSVVQMYGSNDDLVDDNSSSHSSLKPSRSLAQLCDVDDDDDLPTTNFLIRQFESLKTVHDK